MHVAVPREGARVEGVPPGRYQVGYDGEIEYEGRILTRTQWFREIQVVAGATEEIRLP